jgi:hypothetical protein
VNLYALRKAAAVRKLDTHDPEWHHRFRGDWERAEEFYFRPKLGHVVSGNGNDSPLEYSTEPYRDPDEDDGITFDDDLEDRNDDAN